MALQLLLKPEKDPKGQSIQAHKRLFEEIQGVTHSSSQPSEKRPNIEMGLSRKALWRVPALMQWISVTYRRSRFLGMRYQPVFAILNWKGEIVWSERGWLDLQFHKQESWGSYSAENTCYLSKRKDDCQGVTGLEDDAESQTIPRLWNPTDCAGPDF